MNKLKLAAIMLIAFTAGEYTMKIRAQKKYKAQLAIKNKRIEYFKKRNRQLKTDFEVLAIQGKAWKDAAHEFDRGFLREDVMQRLDEKMLFAYQLKDML